MRAQRDWEADRRICDAATPPPWEPNVSSTASLFSQGQFFITLCACSPLKGISTEDREQVKKDAAFMKAAREGWPAALEEITRLQARVRELEAGNPSSPTEDTRKPPRGGSSTAPPELAAFKVGDLVEKMTGEYRFIGTVVACFRKCNGDSMRVVVENSDGILHIFSPGNLRKVGN